MPRYSFLEIALIGKPVSMVCQGLRQGQLPDAMASMICLLTSS